MRTVAGVSGRQIATRTGISQTKVSRIERGEALMSTRELRAWLDIAEARDRYDEFVGMIEVALNEAGSWRDFMREKSLADMQEQVHNRETRARTIRIFQPTMVPGLLQTAEYARLIFAASEFSEGQDYTAAVHRRVARQELLYRRDHKFEFILTEGALRWLPGPARVMEAQLDRILTISSLDNVTLGVIPLDTQTGPIPWHGFNLYEDVDGESPFVQVETIHAYLTITKPADVAVYGRQFTALMETALTGPNAAKAIKRLAASL